MTRRWTVAAVATLVFAAVPSALGAPILGITGSPDRFKQQTGQASIVHQAFLGWGQGAGYGSTFPSLFQLFGPIPMLHLGTSAGGTTKQAITVPQIAAGVGATAPRRR